METNYNFNQVEQRSTSLASFKVLIKSFLLCVVLGGALLGFLGIASYDFKINYFIGLIFTTLIVSTITLQIKGPKGAKFIYIFVASICVLVAIVVYVQLTQPDPNITL